MNFSRIFLLWISFLIITPSFKLNAQMAGSYTVPGSFASLSAAVASLNSVGISAGTTVYVQAGYTETVAVGGLSLSASGNATAEIVFAKTGTGANPQLIAYAGGTAVPSSATQDGIVQLLGCDYVTFNGIDLFDPNTSNPATMEYGYGFFKTSGTNGCNNNNIFNCKITLNRINNALGSNPANDGSRGIEVVNAIISNHTASLTPTALAGANSNNKFYSNTIENCNIGISLAGYAATVSPYQYTDSNNEVGSAVVSNGNNIINFGGGGTAGAAAAVVAQSQSHLLIWNNTVNNNNGSGVNHSAALRAFYLTGIYNGTTAINNNTITLASGGNTSLLYAIENATGVLGLNNSLNLNGNLITNCSYSSATSGQFRGITISGAQASLSVGNNTLSNNSTAATSGTFAGIFSACQISTVSTITNNQIDIGTFNATSTSLYFGGIITASTLSSCTLAINGNKFQNANFTGATGGTGSGQMIANTGNSAFESISGNRFIGLTFKTTGIVTLILDNHTSPLMSIASNSVINGLSKLPGGGALNGITSSVNSSANGTLSITGNVLSNFTLSGTSQFNGINNTTQGNTVLFIDGNTISNVSTGTGFCYVIKQTQGLAGSILSNNFLSGITTGGGAKGIEIGGIPGLLTVANNTVATFVSGNGLMYGLDVGANSPTVYKNKVYDLAGNGASSTVYGIYMAGGSGTGLPSKVYNNMVGDLRVVSSNNANAVSGIQLMSSNNYDFQYNSIYISTSSTGANFGSSALSVNASIPHAVRNNILINTSTPGTNGRTCALLRSNSTLSTYSLNSNNNIFYAGTVPSASNCIMFDGTNSYSTLATYKNLVAPRDLQSYTENTAFTSTVGSSAGFLHISNTPPSFAESNGISISGTTDDIDGDIRFGNLGYIGTGLGTDIGADEYAGTLIDQVGPSIVTTPLGLTCSTGDRTFTASIADVTGVAGGLISPRVYFRKNAGTYFSSAGTLSSGSSNNGVWSFTISAATMGGINNTDVISYFIVAQDNLATPNVNAEPFPGFSGTDVNTVATPPTAAMIYTVAYLGGVYTVGSSGYFSTLSAAAQAYNTSCLTSSVDLVLTDVLYSAGESFPITFQNSVYASTTNSLHIYPASGVTAVITPTATTDQAVVKFNDARFITLNGVNSGGRALNIVCTNSTSINAGVWLGSSSVGCSNITLQNFKITGASNASAISLYGVLASSGNTAQILASGSNNDNISINGLMIEKLVIAIVSAGNASVTAGGNDNWMISNCQIGPSVFNPTLNLRVSGIYLENTQNTSINTNTISNISSGQTGYLAGLTLGAGVSSTTVSANKIAAINYTNNTTYGAVGIDLQTANSNSNIRLDNNMISEIISGGGSTFSNGASAGIRINSTGGVKIYNNSVAMNHSTTVSGFATNGVSAAFYAGSTASSLELLNNIFYSDIQYNFSNPRTYAIYSDAPVTAFSVMNYNNYITAGTQGVLARVVSTTVNTLPALQTLFGSNANSQSMPVAFTSTNNLHLPPALNGAFDNLGLPIAGITADYDGQTRNITTPDIGADEFTSPNCNTVTTSSISAPTSVSICVGQTLTLSRNTYSNYLPGIQQNWQVAASSGGPYTNLSGATGTAISNSTLSPGTYYFVVANTCTFSNQTAVSNEVTISVSPFPTVSVSSATTTICSGNIVSLVATGAANYTWSPAGSLSSANGAIVNATPSFTTTYNVAGSNPGGCTGPNNTATITINVLPAAGTIAVSASTTNVCQGATINIQAVASSSVYTVTPISYAPILTPTSGVGTLCSNGSAITSIVSGWLDDGNWYVLSLPFQFNFFNTMYSGFALSTNGFITLGNTVPNTYNGFGLTLPNTSAGRPSIGAVYGDLSFASTGTINAFTSGTAPNRKYVINWLNGKFQALNTGTVSVQLILYETTNVIEVHTARNTGQAAASQGIQNAAGTVAYMAPGRNNQVFTVGTSGDAYRWEPTVTYSWSPSNYLAATNASSTQANAIQNNITYTATAMAANGCPITGTLAITTIPSPTLSIAGGTVPVCDGSAVTLTASGAPSYTWSGGLQTSVLSVTPAITTTYVVSGKSTTNNCVGTAVQVVTVNPNPILSITGSTAICLNQSSTLSVSGADTYSWSGLGSTSTISVASSSAGATSYSVVGTDSVTGCSSTSTETVNVFPYPIITISGNTLHCAGAALTLSASGASTYTWNTGATTNTLVGFPTSNTQYTVTGVASAANCSAQAVHSVSMLPAPNISISGTTSFCKGLTTTLTASGANTYTWTTGATTASVQLTPAASTVYSVTGTTTINNCAATATVAVSLLPGPLLTINSPFNSVCPGTNISYTAIGAVSYTWFPTLASGAVITLTPTAGAVYSVSGSGTNNCVSQATISTSLYPPVNVQVPFTTTTVCVGETVELSASGALNYSWEPGLVVGPSFNLMVASSTVYSVTGLDGNSCSDTKTISVIADECTGLSKYGPKQRIKLFPNPASNVITISSDLLSATITIEDIAGRVLVNKELLLTNALAQLELDLPNGAYLVRLTNAGTEITTYKLIINK